MRNGLRCQSLPTPRSLEQSARPGTLECVCLIHSFSYYIITCSMLRIFILPSIIVYSQFGFTITNDLFRSSKKAGPKDGMKASTAEGNSLRWKKLHFLACLIYISTEIHRNTVSAFPYNNCRLKLKATGSVASTRHSK